MKILNYFLLNVTLWKLMWYYNYNFNRNRSGCFLSPEKYSYKHFICFCACLHIVCAEVCMWSPIIDIILCCLHVYMFHVPKWVETSAHVYMYNPMIDFTCFALLSTMVTKCRISEVKIIDCANLGVQFSLESPCPDLHSTGIQWTAVPVSFLFTLLIIYRHSINEVFKF